MKPETASAHNAPLTGEHSFVPNKSIDELTREELIEKFKHFGLHVNETADVVDMNRALKSLGNTVDRCVVKRKKKKLTR